MSTLGNYNILVLGESGSGKTSFLAAMYDKLSVQKADTGFSVQLPEREQKKLVHMFREIEDPKRDWPPGTTDVREWELTCAIQTKIGNIPLFRFSYLDYSGGWISDEEKTDFSFYKVAEGANAILVILDGVKIFHMLEDTQHTLDSPLHNDLRFILPILNDHLSKPLHFVITKWDILEKKYELDVIREALFKIESFAAIVSMRNNQGSPTRLIPVSAVGNGFATLSTDQNLMIKNPKGIAQPYQVEIPIACVLMDDFGVFQRNNLSEKDKLDILKKRGFIGLIIQRLTGGVDAAIPYLPLPTDDSITRPALKLLVALTNQRLKYSQEYINEQIDALSENVKNKEEAYLKLIIQFNLLVEKLEREIPASYL